VFRYNPAMFEFLLASAIVAALFITALITAVITPRLMIELGLWVLAGGLLVGIPTGVWYHVRLYRALAGRITLPRGWWRRPVELHPLLRPQEYGLVRPWFVAGAVGFVLCCLGGVAAIIGLVVVRYR
jgi:hypothetical protein